MEDKMEDKIEINDEFKCAYDLINSGSECVFITGKAGVGKTTFLHYYVKRANKRTIVLAPTGVSALNCGGETVHSFFNFKPDVTLSKIKGKKLSEKSIYKKVKTIIIDEASMLRCDILDCVDKFLRLNRGNQQEPFGGVQMVFIGDLRQLPPVVKREEYQIFNSIYKSPYFLSAKSLGKCMLRTVELKKIYRQRDGNFVKLLNNVRDGTAGACEISELNKRVSSQNSDKPMAVYLTTTNKRAAFINRKYLLKIKCEPVRFMAKTKDIEENLKVMPAELELIIKKGAQVMMLNNDAKNRWVNGSIGVVEDIKGSVDPDKALIQVKFPNEKVENVERYKWELFKYRWDEKKGQIETESAGVFEQYPLRLSWAITIHKSQGKTFDNIIIDMEYGSFAPGQLYVALSRCTSFGGITLSRPLTQRDILTPTVQY
ncbi:ATP-dependent RecD-like DNA helicase [Candidatus Endomicrobiellum agilis]|uniref:ATP-dependent DNA helicase n=1 Tax=Candidatus Endomicrobiellum agilis TaxID=3238957 RepID=UPI0035804A35|nr:DEAD/DEAH box helicase [Endomicrobium sp.]